MDNTNKGNFKIVCGERMLKQLTNIREIIGCKKIRTTVVVGDIGDCSIFIKKDLTRAKGIAIKSKKHPEWIETRDIFSTTSGSIIYFDEKVKNFFKENCIYPVLIYETPDFSRIEKLLKAYSIINNIWNI